MSISIQGSSVGLEHPAGVPTQSEGDQGKLLIISTISEEIQGPEGVNQDNRKEGACSREMKQCVLFHRQEKAWNIHRTKRHP